MHQTTLPERTFTAGRADSNPIPRPEEFGLHYGVMHLRFEDIEEAVFAYLLAESRWHIGASQRSSKPVTSSPSLRRSWCMSTSANTSSAAFRATLAQLVSPLRRLRPRIPFFRLPAHRLPTLSLYRSLLRSAPDDNIRWRVKSLFRKHRHVTKTERVQRELLKGYKVHGFLRNGTLSSSLAQWLDAFKAAQAGDEKQRAILARYSSLIAKRCEKADWEESIQRELEWQKHLKSRPILTGALMKPTLYLPPLPRMKPQPPSISAIYRARMRARIRRTEAREQLKEDLNDLSIEAAFEQGLLDMGERFDPVHATQDAFDGWRQPINTALKTITNYQQREFDRAAMPVSPELENTLKAARREKIANKMRERERERRGEILPRTLRRMRQGPPAHLLVHMDQQARHNDRVVRGISEVGYVGLVKRRVGWKLADGGAGLRRENSLDLEGERQVQLRELEKEVAAEQAKRLEQQ
ncbi:hypothetical protein MKEN_00048800 [Mycena kentingensis (nom. inval.)]|nr:hypothetical protein MKEN_00048800 [Mycena kentingensis (nom. inval.)]